MNTLPVELHEKIMHMSMELFVSEKQKNFKNVHHELIHGWWFKNIQGHKYEIVTVYSPEPIFIEHLDIKEIYNLFDSKTYSYKPILNLIWEGPYIWLLNPTINYEHADRLPPLMGNI